MTTAGAVTLASALGVASGGTALSTYTGAGRILQSTGADVLVAGNFVFKSENPIHTIQELKNVSF